MQARRAVAIHRLLRGYLFLPSVLAAAGAALAFALVAVDRRLLSSEALPFVYSGGPEGAAGLLSTVATATITVGGVVFSVTMVTLSLAMSQFGPRLVPTLLSDRSNQAVLGVFVGTFVYSLLVLRTIGLEGESGFVPHLSTTVALGLAVASLGFLVYFLHNVSTSIQIGHVTRRTWEELRDGLEEAFPPPRHASGGAGPDGLSEGFEAGSRAIAAREAGYLEDVEREELLKQAARHDVVVRVDVRPGVFVEPGTTLARVHPPDRGGESLDEAVRAAFSLGPERTAIQDPEFILEKLGQLALRALSPALNDPFTASTCIDWMAAGLAMAAERTRPSTTERDEDGRVRVLSLPLSFERLAAAVFDPLRPAAAVHPRVAEHLIGALARVGARARREEDRAALREHARLLEREALGAAKHEHDRRRIEAAVERAQAALSGALVSSRRA